MTYIETSKLVKRYGEGEAAVMALGGVSLGIGQGEFVAVMGPSGSGKSTLLSLLGALSSPDLGEYRVDDIDITTLSSDRLADFRREYLGFVFQNFNLVPYLSLAENVMLPLATKKLKRKVKRQMAEDALTRVGLGDKADRLPSQVSGGEQERAAVARALVNRPPVLLADEPTGNLDAATTAEVMELLSDLCRQGMTIVMVTHSAECAGYAHRVIHLRDGLLAGEESMLPRAAAGAC